MLYQTGDCTENFQLLSRVGNSSVSKMETRIFAARKRMATTGTANSLVTWYSNREAENS